MRVNFDPDESEGCLMRQIYGLMLVVLLLCLIGCGETQQAADEATKDLQDATTDAVTNTMEDVEETGEQMMDDAGEKIDQLSDDLKAQATEVQAAIAEKTAKLDEVKAKLADLSPQDLLSGDGKALKDESEGLMSEISDLNEKLQTLLGQ
jgi:exonuclease VII large subunit